MLRRSVLCAVLLYANAQTAAQQQPLPTFRSGVDIVQLDVTVLDKDRHPVRGLTAEDFTILEKGKPQSIVAFSAVDVPAPVSYSAPWLRDAPFDVVSNVDNRRLVTLVMDDAYSEANPDISQRAKQIARNAINELGPADLAAVVFTFLGRRQNFTSDRSRLLAAVDSYVPKLTKSGGAPLSCALRYPLCDTQALISVADTLSTASPGRKIVILISGGRSFSFGGPGDRDSEGPELSKLFRDLQRGNITIYAFDARGLPVGGFSAENRQPVKVTPIGQNESLHTFAASTGGWIVENTNDPQAHVAAAFHESSTYYFIGFRATTDSKDKGLRKIEVKVNRAGVQALTRSGYYPEDRAPENWDVVNGLPTGDLPVHVAAAAVATPDRRNAEVILAARVDVPVSPPMRRTVEVAAMAIDLDAKPKGIQRQTIALTPTRSSGMAPDLPAHLPLAPGRYVIQFSAHSEDRAGSAAVDVDVPNFANDPFSASGLLLHLRQRATPVSAKAIADFVPFMPTTVREFHNDDDVAAFVRIYQGGRGNVAPVRITARVRDERNAVSSNYEAVLEVESFANNRSADFDMTLPLEQLSPGQYLLEIEARVGDRRVQRTARFTLR